MKQVLEINMLIKATFELEQAILLEKNLIPEAFVEINSTTQEIKSILPLIPEWLKEAICSSTMILCPEEDYFELDPEIIIHFDTIRI